MFYVLLYEDILLIIFGDIQLQDYSLEPFSVQTFIDCFRLCAELQSVGPLRVILSVSVLLEFSSQCAFFVFFLPVSSLCSLIVG